MILIAWLIALELKEINFGNRFWNRFWKLSNAIEIIWRLKDGNVYPKEVLKNHVKFKLDLNEIKVQLKILLLLFHLQEKIINFFRDYSLLLSETKYKTKHGKGLKILNPKQILQRLPVALAKAKADNNSENLLKVYSW